MVEICAGNVDLHFEQRHLASSDHQVNERLLKSKRTGLDRDTDELPDMRETIEDNHTKNGISVRAAWVCERQGGVHMGFTDAIVRGNKLTQRPRR